MSGFFIAWHLIRSLISRFCLGSLGRAQPANLFRISQQRPINLNTIPCPNLMSVWISDHLAEYPDRTITQIQLWKLFAYSRIKQRGLTVVPEGTVTQRST